MPEELTSREKEIFTLLLKGVSPREIAHKLNITAHTVDAHRTSLYRKLGVRNNQELLVQYLHKSSAATTFSIILAPNSPWGWSIRFTPSVFNNTIISAGDSYTFFYSFSSNVDIDYIEIVFVDMTIEAASYFYVLSPYYKMAVNAKRNIEYSGKVNMIANKSASSIDAEANMFHICAGPKSKGQPTLNFSRFEFVRNV